jgi:hypothetical protein
VTIPLDRDDPAFQRGVLGVAELDLPDWSPVLRRGLYRQPAAAEEAR